MRESVHPKSSLVVRLMRFASWIFRVVSLPLVWLLHANPGERCFGLSGGLSALYVWGILYHLTLGSLFWTLLIVVVIRAVLHETVASPRPGLLHTRYTGQPLLGLWSGRYAEAHLRTAESIGAIGLGILLGLFGSPLGLVFVISAIALALHAECEQWISRQRVLDRIDAEIEARADAAAVEYRMDARFCNDDKQGRFAVTHRLFVGNLPEPQLQLFDSQA